MRGVRFVQWDGDTLVRHAVDQVGNNLTARLHWCDTHLEAVWVYGDGSFECPHDVAVGWNSDGSHRIVPFPLPTLGAPA